MWSVLRFLHPKKEKYNRTTDLDQYENDLNLKKIDFTVKEKGVKQFEWQNPDLPGINVFSMNDQNNIYPLR